MSNFAASADLRSLAADLAWASHEGITQAAAKTVQETAARTQALAVAKAPRKTGELANSIQTQWVDLLTAIIGPTVLYGVFVEFGTGSRGEFPGQPYEIKPVKAEFLVFTVNGKVVHAKKVTHPGIKAEPYMRPAVMEALEPATADLLRRGALIILRGPNSALT